MNDRQLRALVAVGETGSMNKAAGQVYISVPALKKQMDTLEKELGVTLFFRTNQGVSLTQAGEEFCTYARRTITELDEELEKLRSIRDEEELHIRIGYDNSYVLDAMFYHAVPIFREKMQNVKITTKRMPNFDGKKLDLFFGANYAEAGDVTMHYLCDLPMTCLIPRAYPLANQKSLSLDNLHGERLLFPPREMLTIGAPELLNALAHQEQKIEFVQMNDASGQYIQKGLLQGQIGVMIGFEEHVNEKLVQIPLSGYKFRYRIYSVGAEKKPCLRQFIGFLKDFYPKKCAEMCAQLSLNA